VNDIRVLSATVEEKQKAVSRFREETLCKRILVLIEYGTYRNLEYMKMMWILILIQSKSR
jgi:tRNA G10  N-methylase Trm11